MQNLNRYGDADTRVSRIALLILTNSQAKNSSRSNSNISRKGSKNNWKLKLKVFYLEVINPLNNKQQILHCPKLKEVD